MTALKRSKLFWLVLVPGIAYWANLALFGLMWLLVPFTPGNTPFVFGYLGLLVATGLSSISMIFGVVCLIWAIVETVSKRELSRWWIITLVNLSPGIVYLYFYLPVAARQMINETQLGG